MYVCIYVCKYQTVVICLPEPPLEEEEGGDDEAGQFGGPHEKGARGRGGVEGRGQGEQAAVRVWMMYFLLLVRFTYIYTHTHESIQMKKQN
jgi:hypothetical protein